MAELALVRRQPPAVRRALAGQVRHRMALRALQRSVRTRERPAGDRLVVEARDLEGRRRVTPVALEHGPREPKLTQVHVVMASAAVARDTPVARAVSGLAVLRRRVMAAVALRGGVNARERPDTVIDLGKTPPVGLMAVPAA